MRHPAGLIRQRTFIAAVLCGYVVWDLYFLIRGEIPPSIFKSVTGLPCPSSGCWRSLRALMRGDWYTSLLYNPFTVVFCLLLLASVVCIARCLALKKSILLPHWLFVAWIVSLVLAWCAKFLLGSEYW